MDRPEIVDLVAWLEVVADPSSAVALLRLLEGPRYRVGRHDLAAVARRVSELRHRTSTPRGPRRWGSAGWLRSTTWKGRPRTTPVPLSAWATPSAM